MVFQKGDQVRIKSEWLNYLQRKWPGNEWSRRGADFIYTIIEVCKDKDYPYKLSEGTCYWGSSKLDFAVEIPNNIDIDLLL